MKLLKIALPLFLFTFFLSCEDEPKKKVIPPLNPELLHGEWILTSATLNKRPTPRLDSAYFEFIPDGNLKTNILGSAEEGSYTFSVDEKKIVQNTAKTIDYNIEKLVADSLVMNMKIGKKKFRVLLQKEDS